MEKSINNLESLEFWEKVKEEYREIATTQSFYICDASPLFRDSYRFHDDDFKYLATVFLNNYVSYYTFHIPTRPLTPLFVCFSDDAIGYLDDFVDVRKAFIDWNIKRLKNK